LVEDGRRKLACRAAIKRSHSTARKQIATAASQVRDLIEGLDEVLGEITAKLRR
jgi:hypothetical protein